jgi:hypothetical protein
LDEVIVPECEAQGLREALAKAFSLHLLTARPGARRLFLREIAAGGNGVRDWRYREGAEPFQIL